MSLEFSALPVIEGELMRLICAAWRIPKWNQKWMIRKIKSADAETIERKSSLNKGDNGSRCRRDVDALLGWNNKKKVGPHQGTGLKQLGIIQECVGSVA